MNHLTTQEIEAIRKRAEKASNGDWVDYVIQFGCGSEDADFIANARTDIPKLLAEVDRLNDKVAYYLDEMERRQKLYDDLARKQAINGGD